MKKIITALTAFIITVMCITGCGGSSLDINTVSNGILTGVTFAEQLQQTSEKIALKRLGINEADIEECVAFTSTNAVVDEFAIVKASNIDNVTAAIDTHIANQISTYESYAPDEVAKLKDAIIKTAGDYVIYVVSSDGAMAQSVVDSLIK